MEQDRAPAVLPHHPHLAGPAPDERGLGRRHDRHDSGYSKLSGEAILIAAACHARLAMPWALLAALLGVHHTSISVPAAAALQILGLDSPQGPRIRTQPSLQQHAAAARITIPATTRPAPPTK